MARVTVEDCIIQVPNRFELVILSSKRARDIAAGATITVSRDNDKNSVISLREIAESRLNLEEIRAQVIRSMQKATFLEEMAEVDQEGNSFDYQAVSKADAELEADGLEDEDDEDDEALAVSDSDDSERADPSLENDALEDEAFEDDILENDSLEDNECDQPEDD